MAVWSFLLIGLIKINSDNIDLSGVSLTSQSYLKKIPIHRNLLQKEKWNQLLDQTSTTSASERLMTFIDNEVLVDNRTGKRGCLHSCTFITKFTLFLVSASGIDDEQLVKDVEEKLPSLPLAYWTKHKQVQAQANSKNKQCATYPSIFDIQFSNTYWQTLQTTNGTFQLFGAYYDIRKSSRIGPAVRILGMIDRIAPTVKTFCQFWFDGQKDPIIVKTFEYKYIW